MDWYQTLSARRVREYLKRGFSYRTIQERCMVPRWRIQEVVKRDGLGVRRYRSGQTSDAREAIRRINALLRSIRWIKGRR